MSYAYHHPVFYTLSGRCRVVGRNGSFRAEICISAHAWAIMHHARDVSLLEAVQAACAEEHYAAA